MNNTGLIIGVLGIGAAGFLYFRSKQQQAAALAAAQSAPGPGFVKKLENTVGYGLKGLASAPQAVPAVLKTGANVALGVASAVGGRVSGAVGGLIHSIGGIF